MSFNDEANPEFDFYNDEETESEEQHFMDEFGNLLDTKHSVFEDDM